MSEIDPETLSLRRIRRLLDTGAATEEREAAVRQLLPQLWHPWLLRRYAAECALTTSLYLPPGLHFFEYGSFPGHFGRELRRRHKGPMPETPEGRYNCVAQVLMAMLNSYFRAVSGEAGHRQRFSEDVAVDVVDAIGRMGVVDAEPLLLDVLALYYSGGGAMRTALLVSLAALPPDRILGVWKGLSEDRPLRRRCAAVVSYMTNQAATPFLLDALPLQVEPYVEEVGLPIVRQLGILGDPRALPMLTAIARNDRHPLQRAAALAIQRLMKEAEGQEEVVLLRASALATLDEEILLRAAQGDADDHRPRELLRPSEKEASAETAV